MYLELFLHLLETENENSRCKHAHCLFRKRSRFFFFSLFTVTSVQLFLGSCCEIRLDKIVSFPFPAGKFRCLALSNREIVLRWFYFPMSSIFGFAALSCGIASDNTSTNKNNPESRKIFRPPPKKI